MEILLISIYFICMLFIFLFSMAQLQLALIYKKRRQKNPSESKPEIWIGDDKPIVTIQLPVYNERYVVGRLLDVVARMKWPKDKFEIQVLDDSTDITSEIIASRVKDMINQGIQVHHIRRDVRTGYKAGALQYGMKSARGTFIAIFDADFLPQPHFLDQTMAYFKDPSIGMVQTRWEHLNQDFSLLTKLQAFGLDGHFLVEQTGRNEAGLFINFNGTAGVWRKKCIEDAGGWQADTLTEDLDLSYRAQLWGWKFKYVEHVGSPAELPVIMSAVKSQQYRWTKGGAETARKTLPKIFKAHIRLKNKIHAFFHLTNSANFLFLLIASILSVPLLFVKYRHPGLSGVFNSGSIFVLGFLAISYFYWIASKYSPHEPGYKHFRFFPIFIAFSMGLGLHNSIAVVEGYAWYKTPFIRTPKFNINGNSGNLKGNVYNVNKITWVTYLEGLLSLYFFFGICVGIALGDYGMIFFHLMLAAGYAGIFILSLRQ